MTRRSPHYPLFQLKTLTKRMSTFGFPSDLGDRISKIQKWIRYMQEGHQTNEATDAEFISDIFADVLGYKSPFQANSKIWELEYNPQPSLGFFTAVSTDVVAEIYLSDINTKLEPQHSTTEWLIAANYENIYLYHKSKSILFYQQFSLQLLTEDIEYLKQFYFILGRRTLLPGTPNSNEPSRIAQLLKESEQIETAIAKDIYAQYHKIRLQLIKDFQYRLQQLPEAQQVNQSPQNLGVPNQNLASSVNQTAIFQAQKLLNRILFIAFCEDRNLLPDQMLSNAYEFVNPYINQPIWENYKAIFNWICQGGSKLSQPVPKYGGDLFKLDKILDRFLFVGDELCRQIKELTRFDFNEEISHTILVYILEESAKDLALLKEDSDEPSSKRRKARYPPKSLLSCDSVCKILQDHITKKSETLVLAEQSSPESIIEYWQTQKKHLRDLRIVDPHCRAGTYLVTAFDFLLNAYERVDHEIRKQLTKIGTQTATNLKKALPSLQETMAVILQQNLYGCDRSLEAVEITKLGLWLRTVQLNQPLISLEQNIKLGEYPECDFGEQLQNAATQDNLIILN